MSSSIVKSLDSLLSLKKRSDSGEYMFPGSMSVGMLPKHKDVVKSNVQFAVNPKADGERYLLFIDNKGDVNMVSRSMKSIINIQCTSSVLCKNSVLDGEYITLKNGDKAFLAFDGLWTCNKSIETNHYPERYSEIGKVVNTLNSGLCSIKIMLTDVHFGTGLEGGNKVLKTIYPFETDGLIITPSKSPYIRHTWYKQLKWKPMHMNSVDFRVKKSQLSPKSSCYELHIFNKTSKKEELYSINPFMDKHIKMVEGCASKEPIMECTWRLTGIYNPEYQVRHALHATRRL